MAIYLIFTIIGTETASVYGGDASEHLDMISEDATEEELLAQALALSLGAAASSINGISAASQNTSAAPAVSFNLDSNTQASDR